MSPARLVTPRSSAVEAALDRLWVQLGQRVRTERLGRKWPAAQLASRSGISRGALYMLERGESTSLEVAVRCLSALGLRLDFEAVDPRKRKQQTSRAEDPVHAAMGELEAAHLRGLGYSIALDEPYQHFQFAGRADLVAWRRDPPALLHLENRTQFPNYQEAAGSYNAKRAYLAPILAERYRVRRWQSVCHVMACLWSSEVIHALRLHPETFRALAPDPVDAFATWWSGGTPPSGTTSTLILFDPTASGRERQWVDLEAAAGNARPRFRGYADAAARIGALAA